MSRTGARDRTRRQLTETLAVLTQAVSLLGKSRVVSQALAVCRCCRVPSNDRIILQSSAADASRPAP